MEKKTNIKVDIETIEKEFDEIIGYNSFKKEMIRICDIMRNEEFYASLGVSVPNGLLISGDPGLGKTLMANCFIKASGRKAFVCRKDKPDGDFVNHIKSIYDEAVKNAPSIVFLDDMDKYSNTGKYNRNSEEFVTIQSCIDEVKGKHVFTLATINEHDVLPDSLLRAGRFDNRIKVLAPTGEDAEKIVGHYIKKKNFVSEVDVKTITRLLGGASCAELEAVINEAGSYAGFARKTKIEMEDIIKACLRIIHSAPESENPHSPETLKAIAYHEAGHAVCAEILTPDSVNFVSVRSHGGNIGGITDYCQEDDYWIKKECMENRVVAILGGKASTEICFGLADPGVRSDLRRAFDIVERFVDDIAAYGFDSWIHRDDTSNMIYSNRDAKMAYEMEKYYQKAKKILIDNREFLDKVALALMEKDILTSVDIKNIKATCKMVA